jgi:hypothetical protein
MNADGSPKADHLYPSVSNPAPQASLAYIQFSCRVCDGDKVSYLLGFLITPRNARHLVDDLKEDDPKFVAEE